MAQTGTQVVTPTKSVSHKAKPNKVLPTDRITFPKQLDILRAYAIASGLGNKTVLNKDVAAIVKMADTTISTSNAFLTNVGLLQRVEGGFMPSPEVVSFNRAHEWNPEKAAHKLAPLIAQTWFAEAALPKLKFKARTEDEVISDLAEASAAGPDYRNQLDILIEYLQGAGLVRRDGNMVYADQPSSTGTALLPASVTVVGATPTERENKDAGIPTRTATLTTGFIKPTEGTVQFHVSVKVDMAEFGGWPADRISSFFAGIAQVLAAKGALEKQEGAS